MGYKEIEVNVPEEYNIGKVKAFKKVKAFSPTAQFRVSFRVIGDSPENKAVLTCGQDSVTIFKNYVPHCDVIGLEAMPVNLVTVVCYDKASESKATIELWVNSTLVPLLNKLHLLGLQFCALEKFD